MLDTIKVKVNMSVEILEGADTGFKIFERDKVLEATRDYQEGAVSPYELRIALAFMTPKIYREIMSELYKKFDELNGEEGQDNANY